MELKTREAGPFTVVDLAGRFDAYVAPTLVAWLDKATAAPQPHILINLAEVHFIDSTGLAALVQGMKHCRQQEGDLSLCALQQPVRIILELTRLDRAFQIFASESEALESLGG